MHRSPQNPHRSSAVNAEHALGRIGLVPFRPVADGHGRHTLQFGLAVIVGLAKPLVSYHAAGDIFLLGKPLVDGRYLVRIEKPAGADVVVHPLAYRTGILGLVLYHGQKRPHHLHAVHEKGVPSPVCNASLKSADIVGPPAVLNDTPTVTPLGVGHAIEHPVYHLLRIVIGTFLGIQPRGRIDTQRKQYLVKPALFLVVQRPDGLFRPLQIALVPEFPVCGIEHIPVAARSVLL